MIWFFKRRAEKHALKLLELAYMSALTDAVNRNTASVTALKNAYDNQPAAPDESAVASQINANSDVVDAVTAKIPVAASAA